MDKHKQIEEMAGCKDCYDNLGHCPSQDDKEICPCYKNAVENYKQGYRKIPEGAVVLTSEEKQKLLHGMYEQGKFDGVVKFEEMLKAHLKQSYHNLYHADYREGMVSINLGTLIENIDEICKEFTEGKV